MPFPNLSGVPPLKGYSPVAAVVTLGAGVIQDLLSLANQKWQITDSEGNVVLQPDSFLGITYKNNQNISNYPIEEGQFASYNKVQNPFDAVVRLARGGTSSDRQTFIDTVETLSKSLDLYTLVTPEKSYPDVSIEGFDLERRSDTGVGLIIVSIRFIQIQPVQTTTSNAGTITNPASPTSSTFIENGSVICTNSTLTSSLLGTIQ